MLDAGRDATLPVVRNPGDGIVKDLAHYKDVLLTRKRELYGRLHKIDRDLDTLKSSDSGERAVERENDGVLEEFGATGLKELAAIDAALDRLAAGTFGTCAKCGKPISAERLSAVPQAALCEECIAGP
jgi:RNA polymerase-binding transcription factor DksA